MWLRWMLRRRVANLEAVVAAMLANQRLMADALQTIVGSCNDNAAATNANFDAFRVAIQELVDRTDDTDDWWRRSP